MSRRHTQPPGVQTHAPPVRIAHGSMALAIADGWRIDNAEPIFPFRFPGWLVLDGGVEASLTRHGAPGMATALHPHTLTAFRLHDEILPQRHGYPFNVRIPTELGFRNPKFVTTLYVTGQQPRGVWPDRGYNGFSGLQA